MQELYGEGKSAAEVAKAGPATFPRWGFPVPVNLECGKEQLKVSWDEWWLQVNSHSQHCSSGKPHLGIFGPHEGQRSFPAVFFLHGILEELFRYWFRWTEL